MSERIKKSVIRDWENMPEGSVFYVDDEDKEFYYGTWPVSCGTLKVKVPKNVCEDFVSLYERLKALRNNAP